MTEAASGGNRLGVRLRELRETWPGKSVTQKHLSEALGTSTASISSYESGTVPPEDRLRGYARFFCTPRTLEGTKARLIPADELTPAEERLREQLINELVGLRQQALNRGPAAERPQTGALGGKFWYFADGRPVTILYTAFSQRQLGLKDGVPLDEAPPIVKYATRSHPNYIGSLRNADSDAVIELVGHIRAENPQIEVRWLAYEDVTSSDQLTGHLVLLGGGDTTLVSLGESPTDWFFRRLDLPVLTEVPEDGDQEYDAQFVVTTDENGDPKFQGPGREEYRPRFLREENTPGRPRVMVGSSPQLEYDLALLVRQRNPLNLSAKITLCSGIFSRGTYGVVRATTDKNFRERNERYLSEQFTDDDDFWMILQVPVFGAETITPDFERPFLRLRSSR